MNHTQKKNKKKLLLLVNKW